MSSANDNLHSFVTFIARSPDTCWRAFTDASSLVAWVPGLRRALVVAAQPDGYALEVAFELASLSYSLVYTYEPVERRVDWEPRMGKRDGVRGFARFEACDGGTSMTYGIEQGPGRKYTALEIADTEALLAAFKRFVESGRPSTAALPAIAYR